MEYRYRRRNVRASTRGTWQPAYYAATALFLAVVVVIAFSPPSTWVAKRVLAPVFSGVEWKQSVNTEAEADAAAVQTDTRTETQTYVLPAYACYALQIGIYEDEENARTQAQKLTKLGAAGRVTEDDGRYRVLASGYEVQADAKIVQQQLAGEGIESYVYPVVCGERTYTVVGDALQTETFHAALADISNVLSALYEAMIAFDRESLHASEGLLSARTVAETCRARRDALAGLTDDDAGQVYSVRMFYDKLHAEASAVAEMQATEISALSARLKSLYLHAVYARAAL